MKLGRKSLRTPAQVLAEFKRKGQSIRSWALAQGVCPMTAANVVAGRSPGLYGEAHNVAVLLGIKDGLVRRTRNKPVAGRHAIDRRRTERRAPGDRRRSESGRRGGSK